LKGALRGLDKGKEIMPTGILPIYPEMTQKAKRKTHGRLAKKIKFPTRHPAATSLLLKYGKVGPTKENGITMVRSQKAGLGRKAAEHQM